MTIGMVIIMLAYSVILEMGFTQAALMSILIQFVLIFALAFVVEQILVVHNVHKLHKILVKPGKPGFVPILVFSVLMVTAMSLTMSLIMSLIYRGTGPNFGMEFLNIWLRNYPVALVAQLLIVGPIVRVIHLRIFKQSPLVD